MDIMNRLEYLLEKSLDSAVREQNIKNLSLDLAQIIPDISNQYSNFILKGFWDKKVRYMHAFQMSLCNIKENSFVVDIGDSSGTHLIYLKASYNINTLSINIDPQAIERIEKRGLPAKNINAEDYKEKADVCLCFETLEHMENPIGFLKNLNTKHLIITVPYVTESRVGLYHKNKTYENTHCFELKPSDWKKIMIDTGWRVEKEQIYLQYPRKNIFYLTKPLWKKYDYEGFWGVILKK